MRVRANEAQRILIACGAEPQLVLLGHLKQRSRSHTKKGPGRVHQQGKPVEKEGGPDEHEHGGFL